MLRVSSWYISSRVAASEPYPQLPEEPRVGLKVYVAEPGLRGRVATAETLLSQGQPHACPREAQFPALLPSQAWKGLSEVGLPPAPSPSGWDSRPGFCPFPPACPEQRPFHTLVPVSLAFSDSEASGPGEKTFVGYPAPKQLGLRNPYRASVGE